MLPQLDVFLAEMAESGRSPHTLRAYRTDLCSFAGAPTVAALRSHLVRFAHLAPGTRARKAASFSAYCRWAVRNELLPENPVDRLERVKVEPPPPKGLTRPQFAAILAQAASPRDRLLYRFLFELGLRVGEALLIHVEDLDLARDDERVIVLGKGGRRRTLLLDDPTLVRELRAYLKKAGYAHGLLFRAEKNSTGGPLRYQSIQERWAAACQRAGILATLHACRHGHARELVNAAGTTGTAVSLATIRKRLGHRHITSTLRYAELPDQAADQEMPAWRRGLSGYVRGGSPFRSNPAAEASR